jgi:hypothetical protein
MSTLTLLVWMLFLHLSFGNYKYDSDMERKHIPIEEYVFMFVGLQRIFIESVGS